MTFDEALATAIKAKEKWGGGSSEAWLINAMASLGVLKLDEPEMVYSGPALAAIDAVIGNKFTSAVHVTRALDAAGFKIVRKSA